MSDKFNTEEFLNEIEEHFEEISVDQFEKNLKKAGIERIEEPSSPNIKEASLASENIASKIGSFNQRDKTGHVYNAKGDIFDNDSSTNKYKSYDPEGDAA